MSQTASNIMMILGSVLTSAAGQTLLKLGLDRGGAGRTQGAADFLLTAFRTWEVWAGLGLFAASVIIWMRVLSLSDLSWGYPLLGLSYVFVAIAGWLVFGEHIGVARLAGIGFVLFGAALIASS